MFIVLKRDGIRYNEEKFNIDWGIDSKEIIVSEKDKNLNFKIHE